MPTPAGAWPRGPRHRQWVPSSTKSTSTPASSPEPTATSTRLMPSSGSSQSLSSLIFGCASGISLTGIRSLERKGLMARRPLESTANAVRVRQPSASSLSPSGARTPVNPCSAASILPRRSSCSVKIWPFSSRWCSREMWPNSAPPTGRMPRSAARRESAAAQKCGTRCSEASWTSTTSPRQKRDFSPESRRAMLTSSPGMPWRTKITRPSWRATLCPPWAAAPRRTRRMFVSVLMGFNLSRWKLAVMPKWSCGPGRPARSSRRRRPNPRMRGATARRPRRRRARSAGGS